MKINAPISGIQKLIRGKKFVGKSLEREVLDELGFFIVKDGLGKANATRYFKTYQKLTEQGVLKRSKLHSTEVKISHVNDFDDIGTLPKLKSLWTHFFDGKVGLSFKRILCKSESSPAPVFLHQDTCYQYGDTEQYSIFLALTECSGWNGGLKFYPGTHKLGYLGDAGVLNPNVLPEGLPVCSPELESGDLVIMHSATWHFSDAFQNGVERTYLELHILSAESPFSQEVLTGNPISNWSVNYDPVMRKDANFFIRSRSQLIKDQKKEIEQLKSTSNG